MNYIKIRKVAVLLMALTSTLGATTEDDKENMKLKVTKEKESENKIDINLDNLDTQGDEESLFYQTSLFKVFMKATTCTALISCFWKCFDIFGEGSFKNFYRVNYRYVALAFAVFPFIKALATYYLLEYKTTGLSRWISIPLAYGALEAVISFITYSNDFFGNLGEKIKDNIVAVIGVNIVFTLVSTLIVYLMGSWINYLWEWECRQVAEAEAKESLNLDANKNLTLEEAELD